MTDSDEKNIPVNGDSGEQGQETGQTGQETEKPGTAKKKKIIGGHRKETEELANRLIEMNDKYLRLSAEFDNFRKRTLKEKMELTKTGGESVLINVLPVVDNLERAMLSVRETSDIEAVKQGIELIYSKFKDFLKQNGVKEIECLKLDFNPDFHEALVKIPAEDPDMKGKVVDVVEKGYYLHDKVIRFAKVVVGD